MFQGSSAFVRSLRWKYISLISLYSLILCGAVFLLYYEPHHVISFELYFFDPVIEQFLFISNIVTTVGTIFVALITYLCWCIIRAKQIKIFRYMLTAAGLVSILDACTVFIYSGTHTELEKIAKDVLLQWIHDYHDLPKVKAIVDYIQTELECCGYESSYDWYYHANGVPPSCCIINFTSNDVCQEENTFSAGCSDKIVHMVKETHNEHMWIIFWISLLMVGIVHDADNYIYRTNLLGKLELEAIHFHVFNDFSFEDPSESGLEKFSQKLGFSFLQNFLIIDILERRVELEPWQDKTETAVIFVGNIRSLLPIIRQRSDIFPSDMYTGR